MVRRTPAPRLAGHVSSYYGFREDPGTAVRRREGPGTDVVVILTFLGELFGLLLTRNTGLPL